MKKIAIIGPFRAANPINGQTVKIKNLWDALAFSKEVELVQVDTYNWKKHPIRLFLNVRRALKTCDSVIMLPAKKGVKVFARLLLFLNKRKKKKLYYSVVGGWLPEFLVVDDKLKSCLLQFDGIWVETETMRRVLSEMEMNNVTVVPNFKDIVPLSEVCLPSSQMPIHLAIFSRVSKLKGVTDAINAVKKVNQNGKKLQLDIYGPIDGSYQSEFAQLLAQNSDAVAYKGVIDPKESVGVLKSYTALLFPTKSFTEGIPGTIIDAYCAGVPVISAKWESYADICVENVTSIGYAFHDFDAFVSILQDVSEHPERMIAMRPACIKEAKKYISSEAASQLMKML